MGKDTTTEKSENSLEYTRQFKPHLRFDIGDIVYLKSDLDRNCPMNVSALYAMADWADYYVVWVTSQKTVDSCDFFDRSLMK